MVQLLDLSSYDALSPKQQTLASFIAENPSFASFATAAELADRIGVSESTVVRFSQEVGFDSYKEFRQNVRHQYLGMLQPLEALQEHQQLNLEGDDLFHRQVAQDINNLRSALETVRKSDFEHLVQQIDQAREIVFVASGSYSTVAMVFSHLLRFMGYRATAEDRGGPHLTAAITPLDSHDLVIGISFWRVVREIAEVVGWASERGVSTIAITDTVYSPMARAANRSVIVPTESMSFFQSLVAPLALAYAAIAQLALNANEERRRLMSEAERSYKDFNITFS